MSVLHSPRAPWLMLVVFVLCAMTFFSLAVGRDVGLVTALFNPESPVTFREEVQRLYTRWREGAHTEHASAPTAEHLGQGKAQTPVASPSFRSTVRHPPPASSSEPPDSSAPQDHEGEAGRLLSHSFSQIESGFQAGFRANRRVPRPKHFFLGQPARWVVDIPGKWRNMARFNNTIASGFIHQVILGEHEDYLRIVFHFRNKDLSRPEHTLDIARQDNDLTVTISMPDGD